MIEMEEESSSRNRLLDNANTNDSRSIAYLAPFLIMVLLCISFLSFGSYFAYDAVSALEIFIREDFKVGAFEFGLLYSVYSFPNIFLVLAGGVIIDRMGNRFSAILFCTLFTLGAFIVAIAPYFQSFYLMLIGRFIFGLGAESSYVVQNNLCIEWFSGSNHLALAMGVTLTISRLGSILAFSTEAAIASWLQHYTYALFFAFLICVVSLSTAILFYVLDRYAKRKHTAPLKATMSCKDSCPDPRAFNRHYWLWVLIGVTIYGTIFPFLGMSSTYVVKKWNVTPDRAGLYLSFIDLTALFASPLFGWIVDKTGKRGYLVIVGNSLAVIGYLLLAVTYTFPLIGIMILGLHFSLMPAALWPCVPLLVDKKQSGLAFAIISVLINASLTGINPLAGLIADTSGFTSFLLFLAGISFLSVCFAIIWNILDRTRHPPLLNSKEALKIIEAEQQ